jgi:hypothetical protein
MAKADLGWAQTPHEVAVAWSKFILDEMIERKEAGTPLYASVFPFTQGEGGIVLPSGALPLGFPPDPKVAESHLRMYSDQGLYAYLVVTLGIPEAPGEWLSPGVSDKERAEIEIGVPGGLCEPGPHEWYLVGSLVSPEQPYTWAARWDGEKFGPLRYVAGNFGGTLIGLLGIGCH